MTGLTAAGMVFFFCPRGYGSPGKDDYLLYMVSVPAASRT